MFHKLTIAFLLLSTLALAQGATEKEQKYERETSRNVVKDALSKLQSSISRFIQGGLVRLSTVGLTPVLNNLISQQKTLVDTAFSKIDALQTTAHKAGIDVKSCIKNSKEQIKLVGLDFTQDLKKCGTEKIDKANKIVKNAVASIEDTMIQVEEIAREFFKCRSITDVGCFSRVSAKIGWAAVQLPKQISTEVAEAAHLVNTLRYQLGQCAVTIAADTKIDDIVRVVTVCAKGKLN